MTQRPAPQSSWTAAEKRIVFGRVIAERKYRVGRRTVLLQVGTPHVAAWGGDHYCPFRVVNGRRVTVHRAFGLDAVQALQPVFLLIKAVLERISPKIAWDGASEPGDVGIDRLVPSGFGLARDRRTQQALDRAVAAMVRAFRRDAKRRGARRD